MFVNPEGLDKLKYPIGRFEAPVKSDDRFRKKALASIRELPEKLRNALSKLSEKDYDTEYRQGGWTVRELVHHIADSHINAFIRFKLALTESKPVIKPYDQEAWVAMADNKLDPEFSLRIIDGVHARLTRMIEEMKEDDFQRTFVHPEWENELSLDFMLALYGWHSAHHLAHIERLVERLKSPA